MDQTTNSKKITSNKKKKLHDEAIKRFNHAYEADSEQRTKALDDLKFQAGDMWDAKVLNSRKNRPCLTIDKLSEKLAQIRGDQRMLNPRLKVRPVDSKADPDTALIMGGMIKNIENISNAEIAYNTAFDGATKCGRGFWRVKTQYVDNESFDQEIIIERIKNHFACLWDPTAKEYDKSDGRFWFVSDIISREEFDREYPKHTPMDFDTTDQGSKHWSMKDTVRVAEYYYREHGDKRTLYMYLDQDNQPLITDGEIDTDTEEGAAYKFVDKRTVRDSKIMQCIIDGASVLDGPNELEGKYYPIIPVFGEEDYIDGKDIQQGAVRRAKDPSRVINYWWSVLTETVALAPRSPYLVTSKMVDAHKQVWENQDKENFFYLPFTPDPAVPNASPQRQAPPVVPAGQVQVLAMADDALKSATRIYNASLGARSNETSGKAIQARQKEGDIGNYTYADNLRHSMKYHGKVIIDLLPRIYNKSQIVRIIDPEDKEKMVVINEIFRDEFTNEEKIHDLKIGKYDVVANLGPSFSTQRAEAGAEQTVFMQQMPQTADLVADIMVKNQDWPGSEEMSTRLRKVAQFKYPGAVEPTEKEQQEAKAMAEKQQQGGGGPPAPPPNPAEKAKMEQEVEKAAQEHIKTAQEEQKLKNMELDGDIKEARKINEQKKVIST